MFPCLKTMWTHEEYCIVFKWQIMKIQVSIVVNICLLSKSMSPENSSIPIWSNNTVHILEYLVKTIDSPVRDILAASFAPTPRCELSYHPGGLVC